MLFRMKIGCLLQIWIGCGNTKAQVSFCFNLGALRRFASCLFYKKFTILFVPVNFLGISILDALKKA